MDKQIATRVSEELYAVIETNASGNERSVSAEVRLALMAYYAPTIERPDRPFRPDPK
jgi:hypothetical protein